MWSCLGPDPSGSRTCGLHCAKAKIVAAAGRTSGDSPGRRCVGSLADELGIGCGEFPGGHGGFVTHPRALAASLREVLGGHSRSEPAA
jgi:hypothetical protein